MILAENRYPSFRNDAAPSLNHGRGRTHARQPHPIKEAALVSKQERGLFEAENRLQAFDIPQKSWTRRDRRSSLRPKQQAAQADVRMEAMHLPRLMQDHFPCL
jgi:hypothetical protein